MPLTYLASLDQYRETTLDQATKGIDGTNAELTASLNHLSYDADDNFEQLTAIEKTLKRPFSAEALIIQARADGDNLGAREEFSLQARLTAFRQLRHDKQQVLTQLWDEWEAVQMEIIVLTAEVCASGVINLGQDQADKMKDGQQGQFDNTLAKGKRLYDQNTLELNVLNNELQDLEESVNHITSNTNHAVVTMQQVSELAWQKQPQELIILPLQEIQGSEDQIVPGPTPSHRASCIALVTTKRDGIVLRHISTRVKCCDLRTVVSEALRSR